MSKQLSRYRVISNNRLPANDERAQYIKSILCTKSVYLSLKTDRKITFPRYFQSPKLQSYLHYLMAMLYNEAAQHISVSGRNRNKTQYNQYRTCLSYLLYNLHHGSVSGWLMLASFYYRMKHYNTALNIVSYAVSKCTTEKFFYQKNLSSEQCALIKTRTIQSMRITRVLKLLLVRCVEFAQESTLIPEELELEVGNGGHSLPPVVCSHFIRFLCYYHLNNVTQCLSVLADLQITISEDYFILNNRHRANSYNCLGVAYALIGNYESAAHAYHQAIEFDTR
jgi:tetratricopeptide (TPR) repeat protein